MAMWLSIWRISDYWQKYPKEHKILIRPDTVPDDIEMIFECDGLLTARGGQLLTQQSQLPNWARYVW